MSGITVRPISGGTHERLYGQCIKPNSVEEHTVLSSVTSIIPDIGLIPPSSSGTRKTEPERIDWVSIEECDLTDWRFKEELQTVKGRQPPVVIIVGLARGYQVWALMSNGDCEELISYKRGPVKMVKILPRPQPCMDAKEDAFSNVRPLVCDCDSVNVVPHRQHCSLTFVSLKTGNQVHSLRFDEPISTIHCSQRCLVITFSGKLVVCDTLSFTQQFWIRGCFKDEDTAVVPVTLGASWLAFADSKLSSCYQSCGGLMPCDTATPYTAQVMSAAKNLSKTVSALGETVAVSLGAKPLNHFRSSVRPSGSGPGIVTVIDTSRFNKSHFDIHSSSNAVSGLLAHFAAHQDEAVGALKFATNSALLLTCGISGHCFHLFLLLPHPNSSSMSAVHHLYTLFRGNTPAKVQDIAFSLDSRWVSVTTNHGTTHLYPITPYGGPINLRTHGTNKVVNKDSRFYRSAGLDSLESMIPTVASSPPKFSSESHSGSRCSSPSGAHKGSPLTRELHPSMNPAHPSLTKISGNPRLPPYPSPVTVYAFAKIRQQPFGQLANWAPDLSGVKKGNTSHGLIDEVQKFAAAFGCSKGFAALSQPGSSQNSGNQESLFIMSAEGRLTEYSLMVKPLSGVTKVSSETQIELQVTPTAQWVLERTKFSPDIDIPLPGNHLLIQASDLASKYFGIEQRKNAGTLPLTKKHSSNQLGSCWISQVEIISYAGPTRRLWTGPQFTFRTYLDATPTTLVSPDEQPKQVPFKADRSKPMAMPQHVAGHSNPHLRSVPVVIEATSGSFDERRSVGVTMEVCGSWSDKDYISCDEQEGRLRENIAEAMKDSTGPPVVQERLGPLCSGTRDCVGEEDPSLMEDARSSLSESPSQENHLQFPSSFDT